MLNFPHLVTNNKKINTAYRLAVATLAANILPFKDGLLKKEEPVIIAGLGCYVTPWTRDAAINVWNACGLICSDEALNTLKSVLKKTDAGYVIGGEYWDCIIWTAGAWWQYLYTGDKEFLKLAYNAVENSLAFFEETEFSQELNLFRGPACYGDGVAAYPDIYAQNGESGIITFASENKELCEDKGFGIPIYALSTNCLYYYAYILADKMACELEKPQKYSFRAENMKKAINSVFWNKEKQTYNYIYDKFGGCDSAEGMGLSFALLFDIADEEKKQAVIKNAPSTPYGFPCVYPSFSRYNTPDGMGFGRHSGTVWPHIQGFWADAMALNRKVEKFDKEFKAQTDNAIRYYQFAEIYHPLTGEIYGGRQERSKKGISEWDSEPYQTWSATAYLRNVYMNLVGMRFETDGIRFMPVGSSLTDSVTLKSVRYRDSVLNIHLSGKGNIVKKFFINGEIQMKPFVPSNQKGNVNIDIEMG